MAASPTQPRVFVSTEEGPAIPEMRAPDSLERKSILLVEEHGAIRELISAFLKEHVPSLAILGSVQNLEEAHLLCREIRPDLIIFEPLQPGVAPLEMVRQLALCSPRAKMIAFTRSDSPELIVEMRAAGVRGVITRRQPLVEFVSALLTIASGGESFGDEEFARARGVPVSRLTARERMVVGLVADGLSTKEIARQMELSSKTIEKFRQKAMDKLDLHDAVRVTRYAIRNGLSSI